MCSSCDFFWYISSIVLEGMFAALLVWRGSFSMVDGVVVDTEVVSSGFEREK